jgi:hypothetical protein
MALAMIQLSGDVGPPRRAAFLLGAALLQRRLQNLARFAQETPAHRAILLTAELAAVRG